VNSNYELDAGEKFCGKENLGPRGILSPKKSTSKDRGEFCKQKNLLWGTKGILSRETKGNFVNKKICLKGPRGFCQQKIKAHAKFVKILCLEHSKTRCVNNSSAKKNFDSPG
jgi:hypothetical protein